MTSSRCHYEVFCPDNAPAQPANAKLLTALGSSVKWARVTARTDEKRWAAPKFVVGDANSPRPSPLNAASSAEVVALMKKLGVCFVITAEGPAKQLNALMSTLALASSVCAEAKGELVIDRTASIALMPADVTAQCDALTSSGEVTPSDGVTVDRKKTEVSTNGLCKFGAPEIVFSDLSSALEADAATDLIYRQLLSVSLQHGLENGQALPYDPKDPAARLFVSVGTDGKARLADHDLKRAAAVPGIKRFAAFWEKAQK